MKSAKFWVVLVLMVAAAVVLHARGDVDHVPASLPLAELPSVIGGWNSVDIALDDQVKQVLGNGVFLNRVYAPPVGPDVARTMGDVSLGLFIGYFPTQRTGQSIHSPQNCLPGAGWIFEKAGVTNISNPGEKDAVVGEYVISNGASKAEVLYWYQSHGRVIANDYKAKLYMLSDSIRLGRTDAALVRIVTPLQVGEDGSAAHLRAVGFAKHLLPILPKFVPN